MSATTAVWNRVVYAFRSSGMLGVARGAVRKAVRPVAAVETFVLMRAPIAPPAPAGSSTGLACQVLRAGMEWTATLRSWSEARPILERFRYAPAASTLAMTVTSEGDELIGICLWEPDVVGLPGFAIRAPFPSYFVHFIGVRDDRRGCGLALSLLDASDRAAAAAGARWRLALVARHNRPSLRAFAKSGAFPAGRILVVRAFRRTWFSVPAWVHGKPTS